MLRGGRICSIDYIAGLIDHTLLLNIGSNTHAQIDTHLALTSQHIDWTAASEDFNTSGTLTVGDFGTLISEVNPDAENAFRLKGTDTSVDVVIGAAAGFFNVWNAADDTAVFFVEGDTGDANITGCCDVNGDVNVGGDVDATGDIIGASLITGGDIGISGDTDLLQLAANALTVNGDLDVVDIAATQITLNNPTSYQLNIYGWSPLGASAISGSLLLGSNAAFQGQVFYNAGDGTLYIRNTFDHIDGRIRFVTKVAGTDVNAMLIDGDGKVGIGTTAPVSLLEADGPIGLAIQTVTGNTTLNNTYSTILVNASGNVTITLPTAASAYNSTDGIGRIYTVKKIDADADTVTIDGNGAETIDGGVIAVITTQYESVTIQSDGSNWHIL